MPPTVDIFPDKVLPNNIYDVLNEALEQRKKESLYRSLRVNDDFASDFASDKLIDFCSNDYLSFARSEKIKQKVRAFFQKEFYANGSTGSRCISGNTLLAENLEQQIAAFHNAEAALLFNSGYDANVGLFSCVAGENDTIISDELIHASVIDGCRLSRATRYKFLHNDIANLEEQLKRARGNIFIAVESVYSMDGDMAPINDIIELSEKYNANVIVDEAHATGVFGVQGRGLVNAAGLEDRIFARVHTFGKALGCHGATVIGSQVLRDYLINFARSFIFTTALPAHSLLAIKCAYEQLTEGDFDNTALHSLIGFFRKNFRVCDGITLIDSVSPVQSIIIPGSERVGRIAELLKQRGFDVYAVRSPSVPAGKERLRISIHLHNTNEQVNELIQAIDTLMDTGDGV